MYPPSVCWGEDSEHIEQARGPQGRRACSLLRDLFEGSAGRLLTLQPPQVLDDLRRLLFGPERVSLVGVAGGEQPGGRVGGLAFSPIFESLKVEVDVCLLASVHRR